MVTQNVAIHMKENMSFRSKKKFYCTRFNQIPYTDQISEIASYAWTHF